MRAVRLVVGCAAVGFGAVTGMVVVGMLLTPPEHRPRHLRRRLEAHGVWHHRPDEWVNPATGHGPDCGCLSCHLSQVR